VSLVAGWLAKTDSVQLSSIASAKWFQLERPAKTIKVNQYHPQRYTQTSVVLDCCPAASAVR
jgi:hypothetical protein